MTIKNRAMAIASMSMFALFVAGCGDGGSSSNSSSSSGPSELTAEQQSKYDSLSPEGKKYVDEQLRAYDDANR